MMSTLLDSLTQRKRITGRRYYSWQELTAEYGTGLQCVQVLYNIPEKFCCVLLLSILNLAANLWQTGYQCCWVNCSRCSLICIHKV